MRFCLAPTSSSPSTSRIFSLDAFSNASSGTRPSPETSVTWATLRSSASSSEVIGRPVHLVQERKECEVEVDLRRTEFEPGQRFLDFPYSLHERLLR